MGASSRRKGKAGELEVARIFRGAGFDVDRVPNSGGLRLKGDLHGELPVHVEVKRRERLNVQQAYQQAVDEAPPELEPLAACRMSHSPWLGVVALEYLVGLLAIAEAAGLLLDELAADVGAMRLGSRLELAARLRNVKRPRPPA